MNEHSEDQMSSHLPSMVFEDPVAYLAGLGIEADLVAQIEAPLPDAA